MSSANRAAAAAITLALEEWSTSAPSSLLDHGLPCCTGARLWLGCADASRLGTASHISGPRWVREHYKWGPSRWPLHWCEALEATTLDCGALAALAREVFASRGVACFPVQTVEHYPAYVVEHWRRHWRRALGSAGWILGDLVYHECCAVVAGTGALQVWDPTSNVWTDSEHVPGYGAKLAFRVTIPDDAVPAALRWGRHPVVRNVWQAASDGHRIDIGR